jgi:hypothetical protein
MSGSGVIEQYKTVAPFQTIPRWNSSADLLKKAFIADGYAVNNDAIAPSEAYLEAYWETRNQFRRAS